MFDNGDTRYSSHGHQAQCRVLPLHLLVSVEIDAKASRGFQEEAGLASEVAQVTARWVGGLVGGESSVCEEVYALLDPSFDRQVPYHPARVHVWSWLSTAGIRDGHHVA